MASCLRSVALAAVVGALAGCGEQPLQPAGPGTSRPPSLPYTVTVTAELDSVSPGDSAFFRIDVSTSDSTVVITKLGVRFSGPLTGDYTLFENIAGHWQLGLALQVPYGRFEGAFVVSAYARLEAGEVSGRDTVWVYDRRSPVVTVYEFPEFAEPGRNFRLRWTAWDNAAVQSTVVEMTGAVVFRDSTQHYNLPLSVNRDVTVTVAPDAKLGDSILVRLIGVDRHGLADTLEPAPIFLRDLSGPVTQMTLAPHPYKPVIQDRQVYVTGDTIRATITAQDDRLLGWVGWFIPVHPDSVLLRDSVAVSGAQAIVPVEVVVDSGWHTNAGHFGAFSRDSTGNLSQVWTEVWVFDGVRRPYVEVAGDYPGSVADLVYDDRRHRIYMSYPQDLQVIVLDAATGTFDAPIAMPASPLGLDLLPSNDTLVVVLTDTPYLAVVDLTGLTPSVDTLRMYDLGYPGRTPRRVRVAADGQAFVALDASDDTFTYVVDFATGEQRLFPALGWGNEIFRSGDRSTIMTYSAWGYVYRTDTDSVESYPNIYLPKRPDLDRVGRYALSGGRLYDLSFVWLSTVVPENEIIIGWAITADGQAGYYGFPEEWGYFKIQLSDGSLIEHVPLPGWTNRLMEVGDGQFLLVGGAGSTPRYIVDLR